MSIFEQAAYQKLRFSVPGFGGFISTEDLPDLTFLQIDDLAKSLNKAIKESEEESFVVKATTANETLVLKFDIVKHVIRVKLEEKEAAEKAVETKAKKEQILGLISKKQDEKMGDLSIAALTKLLEKL